MCRLSQNSLPANMLKPWPKNTTHHTKDQLRKAYGGESDSDDSYLDNTALKSRRRAEGVTKFGGKVVDQIGKHVEKGHEIR